MSHLLISGAAVVWLLLLAWTLGVLHMAAEEDQVRVEGSWQKRMEAQRDASICA